jgi:hypothetical protein
MHFFKVPQSHFSFTLVLALFLSCTFSSFSQAVYEADSLELFSEREIHRSFDDAEKMSITEVKSAVNRWSDYSTFVDSMAVEVEIANLYNSIHPRADSIGLDFLPFKFAMIGYFRLRNDGMVNNDGVLTIIDYTKPSKDKRFFCIDLVNLKVLFHTYVSHGKNTGNDKALKFSNRPQSLKSSLGLYLTGETYIGSKGYSLRLDGVEKGVNDNMRRRAVVMHSAPYVSESFIEKYGRLGRSFGCPAVPVELHKGIINTIKNKSVVFGYFNDKKYLEESTFIQMRALLKK